MSGFKPGDEVMFRANPDGIVGCGEPLDKNAVYTVEAVGFIAPYHTLLLHGAHNSRRPDGFYAAIAFRKVQRRDLTAWLETAASNTDHLDKPTTAPAPLHPVPSVDALFRRIIAGGDR